MWAGVSVILWKARKLVTSPLILNWSAGLIGLHVGMNYSKIMNTCTTSVTFTFLFTPYFCQKLSSLKRLLRMWIYELKNGQISFSKCLNHWGRRIWIDLHFFIHKSLFFLISSLQFPIASWRLEILFLIKLRLWKIPFLIAKFDDKKIRSENF